MKNINVSNSLGNSTNLLLNDGKNRAEGYYLRSPSIFNFSSISQTKESFPPNISTILKQDPDLLFLIQLLPDIKQLDEKSKSLLKAHMQTSIYKFKYEL